MPACARATASGSSGSGPEHELAELVPEKRKLHGERVREPEADLPLLMELELEPELSLMASHGGVHMERCLGAVVGAR